LISREQWGFAASTKIKTDDVGTAVGIVVVSRTADGCFFHRLFGVLGCRQRRRVIDEYHFLVCDSSVVASIFAPSARVITAKPFQPMNVEPQMPNRSPSSGHVDGLGDGARVFFPRMSGRIHYLRVNTSPTSLVHFFDGSCKTSRRDRPFHPQVSPFQVIARRNGTSPIHA